MFFRSYFCLIGPVSCVSLYKSLHLHEVGMLHFFVVDINQPSLPTPFFYLLCSCVYLCLYVPFNCILFHKFSRQLCVSHPVFPVLFLPYWSFQSHINGRLLQPWYNPLLLTGLKAPTNYVSSSSPPSLSSHHYPRRRETQMSGCSPLFKVFHGWKQWNLLPIGTRWYPSWELSIVWSTLLSGQNEVSVSKLEKDDCLDHFLLRVGGVEGMSKQREKPAVIRLICNEHT